MPASRKPRRAYRPRAVAIPVMPELARDFEALLRTSLGWLDRVRTLEVVEPLDNIAHAANVICGAYPELFAQPAVSGAARTLQALIDRFTAAGRVVVGAHEIAALAPGINVLIERVARADVTRLYLAMEGIRAQRLAEMGGAPIPALHAMHQQGSAAR